MNSFEVLRSILELNKNIKRLKFIRFEDYELIQDRIDTTGELSTIFKKALEIRATTGFPFWDCFNVSLFNSPLNDFEFLSEVKFHNSASKEIDIESNKVISWEDNFLVEEYLTLNSKVKLDRDFDAHIPLLDFHIPPSVSNQLLCENVIKHLKLSGYLLDSGKSYHFYGSEICTQKELLGILAKALLFSPILDKAWIAHQLIEESCCLRITKKYGRLPFLVKEVR